MNNSIPDYIKTIPVNNDTIFRIEYYENYKLVKTEQATKTKPVHIADFNTRYLNDSRWIGSTAIPRKFKKEVLVVFYDNYHLHNVDRESYDLQSYFLNCKDGDYFLYAFEDLYSRMKLSENEEIQLLKTDKEKSEFARDFMRSVLEFGDIFLTISAFITGFMSQNPQYKYFRVYQQTEAI